jgi:hypothetical protein
VYKKSAFFAFLQFLRFKILVKKRQGGRLEYTKHKTHGKSIKEQQKTSDDDDDSDDSDETFCRKQQRQKQRPSEGKRNGGFAEQQER